MTNQTKILLGIAAVAGVWLYVRNQNMGITPTTPGSGGVLLQGGFHTFVAGDYFGKDGYLYNSAGIRYV